MRIFSNLKRWTGIFFVVLAWTSSAAAAPTPQTDTQASVVIEDGIDDNGDAVKASHVIKNEDREESPDPNPKLPTLPKY